VISVRIGSPKSERLQGVYLGKVRGQDRSAKLRWSPRAQMHQTPETGRGSRKKGGRALRPAAQRLCGMGGVHLLPRCSNYSRAKGKGPWPGRVHLVGRRQCGADLACFGPASYPTARIAEMERATAGRGSRSAIALRPVGLALGTAEPCVGARALSAAVRHSSITAFGPAGVPANI
jgi:hypothetical protein